MDGVQDISDVPGRQGVLMAELTIEQLEAKFDRYAREMPEITKESLKKGTKILRDEMRRRYLASGLKKRTGALYESIKVLDVNRSGRTVKASVGIGKARGHSQVYKAVAHELGMTVGHGVTLPKREFVEPTKKAKLKEVREMLVNDLIEGYRRGHV